MYKKMLRATGNLMNSLSSTRHIDVERSAKAYKFYAKEIMSGFNYSSFYNVGDVCWVEFGNNLAPEMSYLHMAVIMKRYDKTYYVLPITTYDVRNSLMVNAYHPIDNQTGNNSYFLMKSIEYPFLMHDSVLKLAELKPISIKRIKSRCGSVSSNNFDIINNLVFCRLFPSEDRMNNILLKENSLLYMKLELANIACEVLDKADIFIDAKYNPMIVELTDNKLELKLTDSYGQSESKIINIKQIKQD